jgi:hypothetical protein
MKLVCINNIDSPWDIEIGKVYQVLETAHDIHDGIVYKLQTSPGCEICWIPESCFTSIEEIRNEKIDCIIK